MFSEIESCPLLKDPENGKVTFSGDEATTVCNSGYAVFGSKTRKCDISGKWSGTDATCRCKS